MAVVTLLSDFGSQDHYVACMKGIITQIAPEATIIDISHDVPPHDVIHAAFLIDQVWDWFGPQTVHVAVVDPGVGTSRRILAARYNGRCIVAPDNGLVSLVHHRLQVEEVRVVANERLLGESRSRTFHGRDILAPVGAHLARGMPLAHVGPMADHLEVLRLPEPARQADGSLHGEILHVDRFGNLISNISASHLALLGPARDRCTVFLADRCIGPIRATYAEVGPGQPLALIGSTGRLEIAVNQGSAAERLGAGRATPLVLRLPD